MTAEHFIQVPHTVVPLYHSTVNCPEVRLTESLGITTAFLSGKILHIPYLCMSFSQRCNANKCDFSKNSDTLCILYIYILFILTISISHEPESHFHLQSMRQSHRHVKAHAQRRLVSFVSVQIYTTYTYSIFISCINFTKSLSRDQNMF